MSRARGFRKASLVFLTLGLLLALRENASAETRTVSWDPVTTYTDGTTIGGGITVTYSVYWSASASLTSLHPIATGLTATSTTFDPDVQGMTRGATAYFTASAALSTGEVSALSPAYAWVVPVVTPPAPTLSGLSIAGASSVNEGSTSTYTATATWSDNTTTSVSPTWSVSTGYATISSSGVLTAAQVTATQSVTVTAGYTSGGTTKTATKSVNVVDVPARIPAVPANIGITGPISSASPAAPSAPATEIWELSWDGITTYSDGTPLEAGRTVRYNIYWSTDPAFPAGSVSVMVSSLSGNFIDFNPVTYGMSKNEKVYFAVRSVLDSGGTSPMSAALYWRVLNEGPTPPTQGKILKK